MEQTTNIRLEVFSCSCVLTSVLFVSQGSRSASPAKRWSPLPPPKKKTTPSNTKRVDVWEHIMGGANQKKEKRRKSRHPLKLSCLFFNTLMFAITPLFPPAPQKQTLIRLIRQQHNLFFALLVLPTAKRRAKCAPVWNIWDPEAAQRVTSLNDLLSSCVYGLRIFFFLVSSLLGF